MKYTIYLMLLSTCLLAGCDSNSSRSVLCVAPQGEFKPESESEILEELNNQIPFTIPAKHFMSKQKSSGLVGWAVVDNEEQKDIVKAKLKNSSTLKLLQVEAMTPEFEEPMKQHKK